MGLFKHFSDGVIVYGPDANLASKKKSKPPVNPRSLNS